MSVTVADCLTLPSLRDATVVAGAAGVNKIVASVTVLESTNISLLDSDLFAGNELAITAFVAAKDDVEMQCDVVRHLYDNGVVAFVLYYIGVIVKKLDKKLIAVGDELNMPLIVMPLKNMKYRYSTTILEVAEAILYDNLHEKYFVPTIIERVAQFPENQRNLDNVLKILSDRFHITIIATDEQLGLISKANWPSTSSFDTERFIKSADKETTRFDRGKIVEINDENTSAFYSSIYVGKNQKMYVFAVIDKGNQPLVTLDKNTLLQISESIQLIVSMRNYSDWSMSSNQLVNAIMNNDIYRTSQIAAQSGIDIKAISDMWILIVSGVSGENRNELLTTNRMLQVKDFLSYRYKTTFVGSFEESMICLMSESPDPETQESAPLEFMNEILVNRDVLLLSFSNLQTPKDARRAYDATQEGWFALKSIYKKRSVFFQQELNFAISCLRIMGQEDNLVNTHTSILDPLLDGNNAEESIETLSVYLLDTRNNIAETARLMHVHPNTIKYRLKEIKKKLKMDIVKLPNAYELYLAVALKRLSGSM